MYSFCFIVLVLCIHLPVSKLQPFLLWNIFSTQLAELLLFLLQTTKIFGLKHCRLLFLFFCLRSGHKFKFCLLTWVLKTKLSDLCQIFASFGQVYCILKWESSVYYWHAWKRFAFSLADIFQPILASWNVFVKNTLHEDFF